MFSKSNSLLCRKALTTSAICLSISALTQVSAVYAQTISGKILNQQGNPISGAFVDINGNEQRTVTDEQGSFTLRDLKAGKVELHTSAKIMRMTINISL